MIEETDASGTMQRDYIFFAGRRIAWRDSSGNVYYYFADTTGSTRVVTDSSGNVCFDTDYYPYGQENDYNTTCTPEYKFAGCEYDSETGNYYAGVYPDLFAGARYYNPRLGRFMSPDPLGGDIRNPQSLNRYAYVLNNPTNWTDPSGAVTLPSYQQLMEESWSIQAASMQFGSNWNEFDLSQIPVVQNGYELGVVNWHPGPSGIEGDSSYTSMLGQQALVPYSQVIGNGFDLFGNSAGFSWSYPSSPGTGAPTESRPHPPQTPTQPSKPAPLQRLKQWVVGEACGHSADTGILLWMRDGALHYGAVGAYAGAAGLGIPTDGIGALPGALLGGLAGGVAGAGGGALEGAAAVTICSHAGVYGSQ